LEFDWESPVWRHFFKELASAHRLIRYDARGNGLSSWGVSDFSLDRQVEDLEAVVDTLGLEQFPLLGLSQGCAKSIAFAARHPERVTKLILLGGYARGWRHRDEPDSVAVGEARCALMRAGWGRDNKAVRQMFTTIYMNGTGPMRPTSGLSITSTARSFQSTIRSKSGSFGSLSNAVRRVRRTRCAIG